MITFAVVGHNEAETLAAALTQADAATVDGDEVVYVDSSSTDASTAVAEACDVETWLGPIGKGAAMRVAFERCTRAWMVFLDADIHGSEHNIAAILARTVRDKPDLDMIVGDFSDPNPGSVLSNTWGIYEPLVGALFPEISNKFGGKPLSGFRAVRVSALSDAAAIPDGFGVEAHLNTTAGWRADGVSVVTLGWYEGRFLYKPHMGREIAAGVLDRAEVVDRLAPEQRPVWDAWVEGVVEVIGTYHGDAAGLSAYRERLRAVRSRPLPAPR